MPLEECAQGIYPSAVGDVKGAFGGEEESGPSPACPIRLALRATFPWGSWPAKGRTDGAREGWAEPFFRQRVA